MVALPPECAPTRLGAAGLADYAPTRSIIAAPGGYYGGMKYRYAVITAFIAMATASYDF